MTPNEFEQLTVFERHFKAALAHAGEELGVAENFAEGIEPALFALLTTYVGLVEFYARDWTHIPVQRDKAIQHLTALFATGVIKCEGE